MLIDKRFILITTQCYQYTIGNKIQLLKNLNSYPYACSTNIHNSSRLSETNTLEISENWKK